MIAKNGDLGFDDLTLDFPTNSLPDIAPSATSQVVPLVSGATTPVQVSLGRVNGSNGPVRVSASDLPQGVSAQPVTVSGTAATATLDLVAAQNAPSTNFTAVRTTITVDPLKDASVAPAQRFTPLDVRVASPYELQLADGTSPNVALPACAPADVPLKLPRDIALKDTIHLSVAGLPAGVSADITPSADVAPGRWPDGRPYDPVHTDDRRAAACRRDRPGAGARGHPLPATTPQRRHAVGDRHLRAGIDPAPVERRHADPGHRQRVLSRDDGGRRQRAGLGRHDARQPEHAQLPRAGARDHRDTSRSSRPRATPPTPPATRCRSTASGTPTASSSRTSTTTDCR